MAARSVPLYALIRAECHILTNKCANREVKFNTTSGVAYSRTYLMYMITC
jgi:hypothetical protein